MEQLKKDISTFRDRLDQSLTKLDFDKLWKRQQELEALSQDPDLWKDQSNAKKITTELSRLKDKLDPWRHLSGELDELSSLADMGDASMEGEIKHQLDTLNAQYDSLGRQLALSGPYDDHGAILSLHAGTGGTDAMDWTQMLLRMYTRYADKEKGLKAKLLDESPGDEAGLKSATLEIDGSFAYGKLKGEHGVHRLVRLSPFNSDNLRQTSFAKVDVMPKIDQPEAVQIDDKDLRVDTFRSSGHGGQSVNTTDSAVRVTHLPTNITVSMQNEKSQIQNRETAMRILRSRLAQLQLEQHTEKIADIKGPNEQAAWGNQVRNYVLHPYKQVKDLRTKHESSDPDSVLDGNIDGFIEAFLEHALAD